MAPDPPEIAQGLQSVSKAKADLARFDDLAARAWQILESNNPYLDQRLKNANLTRGDLEQLVSGEMKDYATDLENRIVHLQKIIDEARIEIERAKPVETAVPKIDGRYDYRMLVDEANDAKIEAVVNTIKLMDDTDPAEKERWGNWIHQAVKEIPRTETFVWGPDILKIVKSTAARTPPDFRLFEGRFVTTSPQWWWWGSTIGVRMGLMYTDPDRKDPTVMPICGMVVAPFSSASLDSGPAEEATILHLLILSGSKYLLATPVVWQHTMDVAALDELYPESDYPNGRTAYNLLAAGLSWMSQKVISTAVHQVGRGARKRADANKVVHTTCVVQLRRTESTHHEGEGRKIEWSHRWMVSEFYRNQWYPSTGRHERILIAAFVKGPADKPLVIKDRVFIVNR